jgi:hypothetical protein
MMLLLYRYKRLSEGPSAECLYEGSRRENFVQGIRSYGLGRWAEMQGRSLPMNGDTGEDRITHVS